LVRLELPPGARRAASEPAGGGTALATPAVREATPVEVDEHAWWRVRGGPRAVLAYVAAHRPAGSRRDLTGRGTSGPGAATGYFAGYAWPPVRGVLARRSLIVTAVGIGGGWTGIRADAEVVWLVPRPPGTMIPSGARTLRVTVSSGPKVLRGPIVVRSPRAIRRIARLLDALPGTQPGAMSCPGAMGRQVRLAFYGRPRGRPVADALVDTGGCGGVRLTIRGRPAVELGLWPRDLVHRLLRSARPTPRRPARARSTP
jgi:hypothetical protein